MTTALIIIIHAEGHGTYTACLGDRIICTGRREPLLSAARVLDAEGLDPDTVLIMRHAGSGTIALRGRLGILAKLAVRETEREGPLFEKYRDRLNSFVLSRRPAAEADCDTERALATV